MFGLLLKRVHSPLGISFHNAKAVTFLDRNDHCTKSDISGALLVERDHRPIVHAINMVTGKDENIVVAGLHNEVQVLVDRVGGALVPVRLPVPSIWLEYVNAALLPVQVPGFANADMLVQRVGAILCQHSDISDAGVDAIAQGEINDAILAGERNRRLGTLLGEETQSLSLASG